MEFLIEYEGGMRFRATGDGYTFTSGKGDDGDSSRDNMSPGRLFVAALGMCIGVYVVGYCRNHDIPCDDLAIDVTRETAQAPSRTTRVDAKIRLGAPLTEQQKDAIIKVAHYCHVHKSIEMGMEINTSFAESAAADTAREGGA